MTGRSLVHRSLKKVSQILRFVTITLHAKPVVFKLLPPIINPFTEDSVLLGHLLYCRTVFPSGPAHGAHDLEDVLQNPRVAVLFFVHVPSERRVVRVTVLPMRGVEL